MQRGFLKLRGLMRNELSNVLEGCFGELPGAEKLLRNSPGRIDVRTVAENFRGEAGRNPAADRNSAAYGVAHARLVNAALAAGMNLCDGS